ncbi:MAG: hypothetical protein AB1546_07495 [bacterium]
MNTVLIFAGLVIIIFVLLRHTRCGTSNVGRSYDEYISKRRLKIPEKDKEFGRDTKWVIGDDGKKS